MTDCWKESAVRIGPEIFRGASLVVFIPLVFLVCSPLWTEVFEEVLVDLEFISVHSSWCTVGGCFQCPAVSVIFPLSHKVRRSQRRVETKNRQVAGNVQELRVFQGKWEPSCFR